MKTAVVDNKEKKKTKKRKARKCKRHRCDHSKIMAKRSRRHSAN